MERDMPHRRRRRVLAVGGAVLLGLLILLGLSLVLRAVGWRLVDADQGLTGKGRAVSLGPMTTVGQTFVARHAGLAGIELWLNPGGTEPLTVTLHLRAGPSTSSDLAVTTAAVPAAAAPGYFRFTFAPRGDSLGRYYYAWIEAHGQAASLALADGAAYLDGAAYQDGVPLDAQTAFHLVYAPAPLILDLAKAIPRALGLVGAVGLLLVLPGWALLAWLGPRRDTSWAERLGLAAGIGLALLPLLFLWTDVVGLHLGAGYAWLPAALGVAFVAWKARRWRYRLFVQALDRWFHSEAAWPDISLLVILAFIVATRLLAVRTLEVPLYGDGYQHTMIAQLLVDHGGLFDSWQPYAAIDRFTYHFGFHAAASALHWLTGSSVLHSVIWTGQMLNALSAITLYPLAVRVSGSRWGGVICALVVGLLSPMPSEYVNWGRYTQLAGQVILPVAAWLTWELAEADGRRWRPVALLALVAGGLALTHYRVLVFYVGFVVALLPFCLRRRTWHRTLLGIAGGAAGAAILFLPWLLHTFQGAAITILGHQLSTMPAEVSTSTREANTIRNLARYLAPGWWLSLPAALIWAAWRRRAGPLAILLWTGLMVLAANPASLGLPGTGAISNFAIVIAAYIPAGLLVGFLAAEALRLLGQRRLWYATAALLTVSAGFWGAQQRLRDLDLGKSAYVTRPDVRAASWIQENTSADARFLANSAPAYGGTSIVGTDGGWWLPLLAGRQNTVPPLNYAIELSRSSALRQQMEMPARLEEAQGVDNPAVIAALRAAGVTHVYIGQRQGAVNDTTSVTLAPDLLLGSSAYQLIYHEDRVWVFRLAAGED